MKTTDDQPSRDFAQGNGRVGYIDALKGFAMLCVVLGHAVSDYMKAGLYAQARAFMLGSFNLIYAFHMPLFMMLSGYVYAKAYPIEHNPAKKEKLHQQIGNLLAVYVIFSVAFGLLKLLFSSRVNQPLTFSTVLMIWMRPITPYWYLYDLIVFYGVFSLNPVRRLDKRIVLCILSALSLLSPWVPVDAFDLSNLLFYALFFCLGMAIQAHPERAAGKNVWGFLIPCVAAIALCALFWYRGPYAKEAASSMLSALPIVNVFVALSISLSLWQLFQRCRLLAENRLLRMIGRYSLEIYVTHCVLIAGFTAVLPRLGVSNALVSVAVNVTLSTAIPVLFALFAKRLKIHALFFRPVAYFAARRAARKNA